MNAGHCQTVKELGILWWLVLYLVLFWSIPSFQALCQMTCHQQKQVSEQLWIPVISSSFPRRSVAQNSQSIPSCILSTFSIVQNSWSLHVQHSYSLNLLADCTGTKGFTERKTPCCACKTPISQKALSQQAMYCGRVPKGTPWDDTFGFLLSKMYPRE